MREAIKKNTSQNLKCQGGKNAEKFWKLHGLRILKPPKTWKLLDTYLRVFEELGFVVIPIAPKGDSFTPIIQWKEINTIDDVRKAIANVNLEKIRGFAVRTGSPSKLVVLDVDDEQKFLKWAEKMLDVESFEELSNLADWTIKTKSGGWHFYFRVTEDIAKLFNSIQRQDNGFDIRGENGLIYFIAWNEDNKQLYQFVGYGNEDEQTKIAFLKDLYRAVYGIKDNSQNELNELSEFEPYSSAWEIIRQAYVNGDLNGWIVEAGLSALLVKYGYSDQEIHKVFEIVYGAEYDPRRTQYIINRTREKGYGICKEFWEFLKTNKLLVKKAKRHIERQNGLVEVDEDLNVVEWVVSKQNIYKMSRGGKVIVRLNRIDIIKRVEVDDGRVGFVVTVAGEKEKNGILWLKAKKDDYEELLGTPLEKEAFEAYKAYIRYLLNTKKLETERFYSTLGWEKLEDKIVFRHPLIIGCENFLPKHFLIERLVVKSKELQKIKEKWEKENQEFLEFLKQQSREATGFAVLYTLGLASLFINLVPTLPFTVIVLGEAGVGKTTACLMVQNALLPPELFVTSNATSNAWELLIANFSNLPILFDELKLAKVDPEEMIFMTASGKGKSRARVDLSVKVKDLNSVVFLTTEFLPTFSRRGAFRRFLLLHVERREDLFGNVGDLPLRFSFFWGHGVNFVKPLMEDVSLVYALWDKAETWLKAKKFNYMEFWHIALPSIASTFLTEHVLGENMEVIRERIYTLIEEQYHTFMESQQDVEELLTEWLTQNRGNFYRIVYRESPQGVIAQEVEPYGQVWGEICNNTGEVYVLPFAFEKLISYCKRPKKRVIEELKARGILKVGQDGRNSQVKRIKGNLVRVYVLQISQALLGQLISHTETEKQEENTRKEEIVEEEIVDDADNDDVDVEKVLENFLADAGIETESIKKITEYAMQIPELTWERKGDTLNWIYRDLLISKMSLNLEELRNIENKEEYVLNVIKKITTEEDLFSLDDESLPF